MAILQGLLVMALLSVVTAATPAAALAAPAAEPPAHVATLSGDGADEGLDGYYTLLGPDGQTVILTGLRVRAGDRFLSEENVWYEVSQVAGFQASLKLLAETQSQVEGIATPVVAPAAPAGMGPLKIGIYHSHSDESYTPSDGKSNIPEHGGIYQVGAAFRDALTRLGYSAVQDLTAHDPHDEGAYARSRRTAMSLLNTGSTVLFDVHRDTAPASAYARTINGQPVTQVMIVVGRSNPMMQATLAFAKAVKDAADQAHPHLIRGIFMGEGGYNQDLTPRALLFEVGSYTNRREDAEAGIRLLADALPGVLGPAGANAAGTQGAPPPAAGKEARGRSSALGWIAGLALVGGAAFLVLAAGGFGPAVERLRLLPREFNDIWPWRRNRT